MKHVDKKASVTQRHSESTNVIIPMVKSENNDPGKGEDEPKEIIESNHDGRQNDAREGTREINFFNSVTLTKSDFLFT